MKILALLLLAAMPSRAADFPFVKQVDPAALQAALGAAGVTDDSISCAADVTHCVILNPSADPSSVVASYVYSDPKQAAVSSRNAAVALVKKLRAGTASQAEKDELLGRLAFMLLSQ